MTMDGIDYATVVGMGMLIAASTVLEGLIVAAGLGGFVLSLATWRLFGGRVWEALGWVAWLGAAAVLVVRPDDHPLLLVAFVGSVLLGIGLQFGGRLELLPDVWSVDDGSAREFDGAETGAGEGEGEGAGTGDPRE